MTDLSIQRALDEALGDFAERRGKLFFQQIKAQHGDSLRERGRFIAIDAITGDFVFGDKLGLAMDALKQKHGERSVAWLVDLYEHCNGD